MEIYVQEVAAASALPSLSATQRELVSIFARAAHALALRLLQRFRAAVSARGCIGADFREMLWLPRSSSALLHPLYPPGVVMVALNLVTQFSEPPARLRLAALVIWGRISSDFKRRPFRPCYRH